MGHACGGDADSDDGLDGDEEDDAWAEEGTEAVWGASCDGEACEGEGCEEGGGAEGAGEAEFFADDGEDEVGVAVGEVEAFLAAVAEDNAPRAASAAGDEGMVLRQVEAEDYMWAVSGDGGAATEGVGGGGCGGGWTVGEGV